MNRMGKRPCQIRSNTAGTKRSAVPRPTAIAVATTMSAIMRSRSVLSTSRANACWNSGERLRRCFRRERLPTKACMDSRPDERRAAEKCDEFPPPHGASPPAETSGQAEAITFGGGAACASQQISAAGNVAWVAQRAAFGDHFMKSLPKREDHMLRPFAVLALVVVTSSGSPAAAQDSWPSKPITVIVPFGAGGNTDSLARIYSARLSARLGQRSEEHTSELQSRPHLVCRL